MDNPEKAYKGQSPVHVPSQTGCRGPPAASDLVRPPELNQARVHKCFLALANRKIITKDASVCAYLSRHPPCLSLIACVGTVSLAGPLIPLSPCTLPTIVVFHHPPQSRHSRRIDYVHPPSLEVYPLPDLSSEITPPVHTQSTRGCSRRSTLS